MPSDILRAAIWIVAPLAGLAILFGAAALESRKGEKAANALYFCGFAGLAGAVAFTWELGASGDAGLALLNGAIWVVLILPLIFLIWFKPRFVAWVAQRKMRNPESAEAERIESK